MTPRFPDFASCAPGGAVVINIRRRLARAALRLRHRNAPPLLIVEHPTRALSCGNDDDFQINITCFVPSPVVGVPLLSRPVTPALDTSPFSDDSSQTPIFLFLGFASDRVWHPLAVGTHRVKAGPIGGTLS
ncbi:hypothetical protein MUK42_28604 [Musa troglodytarum]|uniref:Uncharacterized protein n=1 Tax=Musa troglodytarum TaxID=320322 RepID=A0A9E7KCS1_9LILI|nr:hypothetical protein MUK42_28604 [Musa troglodytarum]